MKDATRIKIAGAATALFIAVLSATGLAVRADHAAHAPATAARASVLQRNLSSSPSNAASQAPSADLEELDDD